MVHAAEVFDYRATVQKVIFDRKNMHVSIFRQILHEVGKLDEVENRYPSDQTPWLFVAYATSRLLKEPNFFIIELHVSYSVSHNFVPP